MKFKLFVPLYGSYGPGGESMMAQAGDIVDIPDWDKSRINKFLLLEGAGKLCKQQLHSPDRKAYTVYENKSVTPEENKAPLRPPIRKK